MEAFLFIVICIVWFISGAASFVYWWTKEYDFTWDYVPLMVIGGVCGPLSFIIGWCIHGESVFGDAFTKVFKVKDGVLFKKRTHLKK